MFAATKAGYVGSSSRSFIAMALRAKITWLVPESARAGPNCVCVCLLVHVGVLVGVLVLTLVFLTLVLLVILELPVLLLPLLVFECWFLFAYRMTMHMCTLCRPPKESTQPSHFFPLGLGPGVGGLLRD